nr:MAG TPA: hypothetical protein [Caudoviricetes sp.]
MTRRAPHRELRLMHPMKTTLTTMTTHQSRRRELPHRRVKHTANLLVQLTPHLQVTHRIATNSEHTQTPGTEPRRVANVIPHLHIHNIKSQRCPRLLTRTTSRARTIRRISQQRDKRRIPLNRIPARRLTLIQLIIIKQLRNYLSKPNRNLRRQQNPYLAKQSNKYQTTAPGKNKHIRTPVTTTHALENTPSHSAPVANAGTHKQNTPTIRRTALDTNNQAHARPTASKALANLTTQPRKTILSIHTTQTSRHPPPGKVTRHQPQSIRNALTIARRKRPRVTHQTSNRPGARNVAHLKHGRPKPANPSTHKKIKQID